jgi:hypothetical protein
MDPQIDGSSLLICSLKRKVFPALEGQRVAMELHMELLQKVVSEWGWGGGGGGGVFKF